MIRNLLLTRTPGTLPRIALLAALAFAAAPTSAVADVQIPLEDVVSEQYQVADAIVDATVPAPAPTRDAPTSVAAEPAPDIVEPAPPPIEPDEPQYHPDNAPQYQMNEPSNNGDVVTQTEDAAVADAASPAEDLPALARDDPPPSQEVMAPPSQPGRAPAESLVELPEVLDLEAETPQFELPLLDAAADDATAPAPVGGNLNVSIRIFSPGEDGPVTQLISGGGGGGGQAAPTVTAPVMWIWNWNWEWSGAAGCDPGAIATPSPGVAEWTWDWTWTCGAAGPLGVVQLPDAESLSDVLPPMITNSGGLLPDMLALPALERFTNLELPPGFPVSALLGLAAPDSVSAADETVADALEARAVRERPGMAVRALPGGGPWTRAQASAAEPPAAALPAAAGVERPGPERHSGRDIKRARDVIPVPGGIAGPSAAAASAAAAGSGPALLAKLVLALLSLFASALLASGGLPRLKPRGARLERPG